MKKFYNIVRKLDHSITFTTYVELLYEREATHDRNVGSRGMEDASQPLPPPKKKMEDQLTLFQPKGADYAGPPH